MTKLLLALILLASSAYSYKINVLNPWAEDPSWETSSLWIRGDDPGHFPGKQMKDEGANWWSYTFTKPLTNVHAHGHYRFFIAVGEPPNFEGSEGFNLSGVVPNSQKVNVKDQFVEWDIFQITPEQIVVTIDTTVKIDTVIAAGSIISIDTTISIDTNDTVIPASSVQEVWIYMNKSGKVIVANEAPETKTLYLFNPWPRSAPRLKLAGGPYKDMNLARDDQGKALCGWFVAYFTAETNYAVHFQEIIGKKLIYGQTGLGSADPIDLTAHFATNDAAYILPSPQPTGTIEAGPPMITGTFPQGVLGQCQYNLAFTIRDFSVEHPDFYAGEIMGGKPVTGMVKEQLGPNGKPVKNKDSYNTKFDEWFTDVPGVNHGKCLDLPMSKTKDGYWQYDSYYTDANGNPNTSHQFFPIDDFNNFNETYAASYQVKRGDTFTPAWKTDPTKHNFHFCLEMHAKFKYEKGQQFTFTGDDDVWAFVNKKLVIDLGGLHPPSVGKVPLDLLGLTEGAEYAFDFFYCERQPVSSNMMIKTSIYFEQEQNFFFTEKEAGTKKIINVWERSGGSGSCADVQDPNNPGKIDTLPAKADIFLSGGVLPAEVKLNTANPYQGKGLDILNETQVELDTAQLRTTEGGLPQGEYILRLESRDTPKRVLSIPFRVYGQYTVRFKSKTVTSQQAGKMVEVIVEAMEDGKPVKHAVQFSLLATGLNIYAADAKTLLTALRTLTTDSATGEAKYYVTVPASVAETKKYTMSVTSGPKSDAWDITFWVPTLQFVDPVSKAVISPQPIGTKALMAGYPIMVRINNSAGDLCTDCTGPLVLQSGSVKFTSDPAAKPPVTQAAPNNGYAAFYIFSNYIPQVEFTVRGQSPATMAVWKSNVTLTYTIKQAWIVDSDKQGDGDMVYVTLDDIISVLPGSVTSIDWPKEGAGSKTGTQGNIKKVGDSTFLIDLTADQFEKGATALDAGSPPTLELQGKKAPIEDRIGPILTGAAIVRPEYRRYILDGDQQRVVHIKPDTLLLTVSEPVVPGAGAAADGWKTLFTYGVTCKEGETGKLVTMSEAPLISGNQIRVPILKAADGTKIEIENCVHFSQNATYTDAKGNAPSPVPVTVTGDPETFNIFNTTLLRDVVGSEDQKLSNQFKTPDQAIAVLDAKGNFLRLESSSVAAVWIPPVHMNDYGEIKPEALASCANAVSRPASIFPKNCLSTVSVISEGPYKATINIYSNVGEFIHSSEQHFGYCNEMEDENRLRPGGFASFLVWNQKDLEGKYVGSGVYIWRVLYKLEDGTIRLEDYRQGIARGDTPSATCAVSQ